MKEKIIILSVILFVAVMGTGLFFVYQSILAQGHDQFADEIAARRNAVIDIAKVWAFEELELSLDNISFEASIIGFGHVELWQVDLKDENDNLITSVNVDPVTEELNEIIIIISPESFVEVNGMVITLVDYTLSRMEVAANLNLNESHNILDFHLDIEEAGAVIAKAIYEQYGMSTNGSRFDMSFWHNYSSGISSWRADVYLDPERTGNPFVIPDFDVMLDAVTGEIKNLVAMDILDNPSFGHR